MDDLSQLFRLATEQQNSGDWQQAEATLRRILAQAPHESATRHRLAWLLQQRGQLDAAIDELKLAIQFHPTSGVLHSHLGSILRQSGRPEEAVASFRTAIELEPGNSIAHFNLGNAYQQLEQFTHAVESYRAALAGLPADPDVHLNLGLAQKELAQLDEARSSLEQALRIKPDFTDAWVNLGVVSKSQGDLEQAEACYRRALAIDDRSALACNNLGSLLQSQYRVSEAIEWLERALCINPKYATAYGNLGDARQAQGNTTEALACIAAAMAIENNDSLKIKSCLTLPVILGTTGQIEASRSRLHEELTRLAGRPLQVKDPVTSVGVPAFYLAYQGYNERDTQARIGQLLHRAAPVLEYTSPHCQAAAARKLGARIKIGLLSQNFYAHTIGKLNLGLIQSLDRQRFEVVVFRFPRREDPMSLAIAAGADRTITLPPQLSAAREQIARERLDALFYTDVGMDSLPCYLAHARLAPVQCVTWGHPLTTGLPTIDYFISSQDLEPNDGDTHYTEKLVKLAHLANYYYRPEPSISRKSRQDLGLTEGDHLYLCPQSLFKLHPDDDNVFRQIVERDPLARIVLIEGQQPTWAGLLRERLSHTMGKASQRVQFVPRQPQPEFQRLLELADIILDPLHFGGGNTSYEAFSVGTPIVTLPGGYLRSRITYALYRWMEIEDCVAADVDDYVAKAVRLGTDSPWREQVRARILAEHHKLYENPAGIRELETFLTQVVTGQ